MTLSSFDLENRFDSRVVRPASAKKTVNPRQVFAPGLHGCPHCQAQALYQAGFADLGRRLMDASALQSLTSEPIEAIKKRLWQLNLYSEGALRPDLATSYVSSSMSDDLTSREQHYRHGKSLPGQSRPCDANQFHDRVARLISENIAKATKSTYPEAEISLLLDKPLHPSRRRPDIQTHVSVLGRQTQVFAIELQLSSITEEKFLLRHRELDALADSVIWVLKKKSRRLRDIASRLIEEGYKAYWFEKSEDSSCKIWPVTSTDLLGRKNVQRREKSTPSVCTRTERENSNQTTEKRFNASNEPPSGVEVRGYIDLLASTAISVVRDGRTFFTTVESPSIAREIRRINRIADGVQSECQRIEGRQEPILFQRAERRRGWAERIDRIAQGSRTERYRIHSKLQPIRDRLKRKSEIICSQETEYLRTNFARLDKFRDSALQRKEQVRRVRDDRRRKERNLALWREREAEWSSITPYWQNLIREVLSQQTFSMKIAQAEGIRVPDTKSLIQFWRSQDRQIAEDYYCQDLNISSIELFLNHSQKFEKFFSEWEKSAADRYIKAKETLLSRRLNHYKNYLWGRPEENSRKEKIDRAVKRIKLGLSLSSAEVSSWSPQLSSFVKKRPIKYGRPVFGCYPPSVPAELEELISLQKSLQHTS